MLKAGNPKLTIRLKSMERFWRPVTRVDLRLNASPIRRCVIRFLHYAQYWLPPHPDSRLKRLTDVCETPKRAWFSLNVGISLFLCTQAIDGSNRPFFPCHRVLDALKQFPHTCFSER